MNTAIIGLGNIGAQVARNLTAGGEAVIVADRTLAKAEKLAAELGGKTKAMTIADAVNKADVIILAIYFAVMKNLIQKYHSALAGKIVVDPSNPIAQDEKGGFRKTIPAEQSSGQLVARLLPEGAEFVKAFGTVSAQSLGSAVNRQPERAVLFYATNYPEAARVVEKLITASGFSPMKVGGIDQSIRIEVGGDLHEYGKLGKVVSRKEAETLLKRQPLSMTDRFAIFEQLQLHQRCIDNDASRVSAMKYVDLYWPEGRFTVHDLRHMTFDGPEGLKRLYDYAHSVFPLHKWFHSAGTFVIDGQGDEATAEWRWTVSWKEDQVGTVSTGTYSDRFQRRNGIWRCLERTSNIDPNWPASLFQPWVDKEKETYKAS